MTQAPGALEVPETTPGQTGLVDRLLQWTVLAVLVITVALYALAPFLAIGWAQRPFIGAFVEKTFIFNGIGDPDDPAWSARQRVPEGDHLLAVDGAPVATSFALGGALADKRAGETVILTTRSRDGSVERQTVVTLSAFPLPDLIRLFIAPYLIGVIYLGIGWWVFQLRRGEPAGRAFALTCALAAIAIGALFDLYTTHLFTWAWTLAVPNVGAAAMSLALVFPKTASPVARRPMLRLISFVPGLLLAAYALVTLYGPGFDPHAYVLAWRYSYFYLGAGLLVLLGMMLYRWRFSPSPTVSAQSRIIFLGAVAAFLPLLIWVLQGLLTNQTPYFNVLVNFGPLVLFPAAVAYAILRYRLLDADVLLGHGIVYGVIGALTVIGYSLIITGLSLIAGVPVNANDPLALGLVVLLLVIAFEPLRDRLRRLVDRTFFRGSRQYAQRLEQFGRIVGDIASRHDITIAIEPICPGECNIVYYVTDALHLARVIDRPSVRVLADYYHMVKQSEPMEHLIEAGSWLRHAHTSDDGRRFPVEGGFDQRLFFRYLQSAGYDERVSLECRAAEGYEQKAIAASAYLRRCWAEASAG